MNNWVSEAVSARKAQHHRAAKPHPAAQIEQPAMSSREESRTSAFRSDKRRRICASFSARERPQ